MKQLWIETGLSWKHTCRTNSCRFHPWIMLIHLKSLVTNSPTIIDINIIENLKRCKIGHSESARCPPAANACPCPVLLAHRRTWRSRSGPLAEIGLIRWLKVAQRSIASSRKRWSTGPPVVPLGLGVLNLDTDFTGAKVSWAKKTKQNVAKKPWQSSDRAMFSMAQGIIRMQMVTSEGTANRQCNVSNQTISHPQLYQKWVPQ